MDKINGISLVFTVSVAPILEPFLEERPIHIKDATEVDIYIDKTGYID